MASAPITRAPKGGLVVPPNPIVPVVAGDGVGPETWALAQRILDAAVQKAYGKAKKIEWLALPAGRATLASDGSALPLTTLAALQEHLVSIVGPFQAGDGQASPALKIRRALGLNAAQAVIRTLRGAPASGPDQLDVRVWWDALEHAGNPLEFAAGMPHAAGFLRMMQLKANEAFLRIRFGSRERVESFLRASGRREAPLVEVALALQPVSWAGAHRLTVAAIRKSREHRRKRLTIVHRSQNPQSEGAFRDWAMRVADEEFVDDAFTSNTFARIAMRNDEEAAITARDGALAEGAVYVEEATFDEALQTALTAPSTLDVVLATADTAAAVARLLALKVGGSALVPVITESREKSRACFGLLGGAQLGEQGLERVNPAGFVLAGEQLLRHLGWVEAADFALKAIESALAQGRLTPDLARLAPQASVITAGQFADAALATL